MKREQVHWSKTMYPKVKQESSGRENKNKRDLVNPAAYEEDTLSAILISFFDEEINPFKFFSSCLDISTVVLLSGACFVLLASLISTIWRVLFHSSDDYSFLTLHLASLPGHNATAFSTFWNNTNLEKFENFLKRQN